jgi:hypothetical protein
MKHINEPPPPLRSIKAGIPRPLEAVVMRALEKDPADRYASAEDMRVALVEAGGGGGSTAVIRNVQRPQRSAAAQPSGDLRSILLVLALIAAAVIGAVALSGLDNSNGDGQSNQDGSKPGGSVGGAAITVENVSDFDPHGGSEHPESAALAADEDDSTAWSTENYNDPLQLIGKPGVGLLFDLGSAGPVDNVEIKATPGIDLELRASDEAPQSEDDMDVVDSAENVSGTTEFSIDGTEARYWLVWITSLPGDGGGSAEIYEVTFSGG